MVIRLRVMEKKLTNSGPLRESVDKHSILLCNQQTPFGLGLGLPSLFKGLVVVGLYLLLLLLISPSLS